MPRPGRPLRLGLVRRREQHRRSVLLLGRDVPQVPVDVVPGHRGGLVLHPVLDVRLHPAHAGDGLLIGDEQAPQEAGGVGEPSAADAAARDAGVKLGVPIGLLDLRSTAGGVLGDGEAIDGLAPALKLVLHDGQLGGPHGEVHAGRQRVRPVADEVDQLGPATVQSVGVDVADLAAFDGGRGRNLGLGCGHALPVLAQALQHGGLTGRLHALHVLDHLRPGDDRAEAPLARVGRPLLGDGDLHVPHPDDLGPVGDLAHDPGDARRPPAAARHALGHPGLLGVVLLDEAHAISGVPLSSSSSQQRQLTCTGGPSTKAVGSSGAPRR